MALQHYIYDIMFSDVVGETLRFLQVFNKIYVCTYLKSFFCILAKVFTALWVTQLIAILFMYAMMFSIIIHTYQTS